LNPGRRGGKPATNRLSYGAANLPGLCLNQLRYHVPLEITKADFLVAKLFVLSRDTLFFTAISTYAAYLTQMNYNQLYGSVLGKLTISQLIRKWHQKQTRILDPYVHDLVHKSLS
jgi:hypothetical protein